MKRYHAIFVFHRSEHVYYIDELENGYYSLVCKMYSEGFRRYLKSKEDAFRVICECESDDMEVR